MSENYNSVTNCMEEILEEISKIKSINLNFFKIIYSDTFGLWSEVFYDNDGNLYFDAHFTSNKDVAIKEIEKKYCLNDGVIKW